MNRFSLALLLALALRTVALGQWYQPSALSDRQIAYGKSGYITAYDAATALDAWMREAELNPLSLAALPAAVSSLVNTTVSNQVVQSASGIYFGGDRVRLNSVSGASLKLNSFPGTIFSAGTIGSGSFVLGEWPNWTSLIPKATFISRNFSPGALKEEHFIDNTISTYEIASGAITESSMSPEVLNTFSGSSAVTGEIKMFIFPPQYTNSMNGSSPDPSYMRGWVVCDGRLVPVGPTLSDGATNYLHELSAMLGATYGTFTGVPASADLVVYYKSTSPPVGNAYVRLPDMRGDFLRGMDEGTGRDRNGSRTLGDSQDAAIESHTHRSYYLGTTADLGVTDMRAANGNSVPADDRSKECVLLAFNPSAAVWTAPSYFQDPFSPAAAVATKSAFAWHSWSYTSYAPVTPGGPRLFDSPVVEPAKVTLFFCIATGVF